MTTERQVELLAEMTTRDHAGRHFTEQYSDSDLDQLEADGLIAIDRPIHGPTGIPCSQEYYSVEVTPEGVDLVQVNPEFWPSEV